LELEFRRRNMKNKKGISIVMAFFFFTFSLMSSMNIQAFGEPTTSLNIPKLNFIQKPLAEYVAGSKVNFVVSATTADNSKVQISAKLYNLDQSIKTLDILNYDKAYESGKSVPMTTTIKTPGNYRVAVYTRINGTIGTNKSYYDNYITFDFKIVKSDVVTNPVVKIDTLKIYADLLSDYKLPSKIIGSSNGKTKQYNITWDKPASTKKAGIFVFTGTIKELNSNKAIKNVKVKLTLVVAPVPAFAATTKAAIDLYSDYKLPDKIYGKMKDGTYKEYGVTWNKAAKTTTPGAFTFVGTVKNLSTLLVLKNVKPKLVLTVSPLPVFNAIVDTVEEGAQYKLPEKVIGKLSNGKTKAFAVFWDKAVDTAKIGSTTFIGSVAYLDTLVKLKNANVILTLTVKEVPVFEPIAVSVTEGIPYTMPETINGKLSNGTVKTYVVAWNGKAQTNIVGTFNFEGTVKDSKTGILVPNVKALLKLVVNQLKPEVLSVKAASTKAFLVNFNKKIDTTKCNILVTMNGIVISLNPTWQADGKSVLLQSQNDLAVGNYIIKVTGIELAVEAYKVEVDKPVLTSVVIPTVFITPNNSAAKILIAGKDQYGQNFDVSADDFNWLITDSSSNLMLKVTTTNQDYITVQTNVLNVKAGDKVSLYCVNKMNTTIIKNAELEINSKPIDSLVLKQPVLGTNEKRLTSKAEAEYYEIPYSAMQNFTVNGTTTQANAIFDDKSEASLDQVVTLNNYYFVTDRPDVLTGIKVENGKLYIKIGANKSGSVKLNATAILENGQTTTSNVSSITINIEAATQPTSIVLGKADSTLVNGGSTVKIPITVYDQYKDVVDAETFARTGFVDFIIVSANTAIATVSFDIDGKNLLIRPVAVGSTSITIINRNSTNAAPVVYTATVNPASVVKEFNVTLDYTYLIKGATANITLDTYDQYANKLTKTASTYKYLLTTANGASYGKLSTNSISVNNAVNNAITIIGMNQGKETITATLYNDLNNNNVVDANEAVIKQFAFNVYIVADNEVLTYTLKPVDVVYATVAQDKSNSGLDMDAYGAVQNQNNKNILYKQIISMNATNVNGYPVALPANPITEISATINGDLIDYIGKSGNDFIVIGRQWSGTELTKDVNLLVTYKDNAGTSRTTNTKLTVSKASLTATKISFMINGSKDNSDLNDTENALGTNFTVSQADFNALNGRKLIENQNLSGLPCYFEVNDQYGVSSMNALNFTVISKQSAKGSFTFDATGTISTSNFVAGDLVTISASDTEGHTITTTIKIQ
jgi:hypothetical protein